MEIEKVENMKRLWLIALLALMIPAFANAKETMILYYQLQIPPDSFGGQQINKSYYIKESLTRVDPKNPNLLQVKTYSTSTTEEGVTKYRVTYRFNCETRKFTIVKHWSSGFGDDKGLMVDGKWSAVADYDELPGLTKKICPKK